MAKFSTFIHLSFKRKILFSSIFILLAAIRLMLICVSFKYITKMLLKSKKLSARKNIVRVNQLSQAAIVGKSVATVAKYTPWNSKCLVQSIVCKIILRFLSIPNTLFIGATKNKEQFIAHAWVTYDNHVINGGANSIDTYKVMATFSDL